MQYLTLKIHTNRFIFTMYTEKDAMGYGELLSSEEDGLDRFIERKLKEAGHGLKDSRIDVQINPPDNFKIKEGQGVILII